MVEKTTERYNLTSCVLMVEPRYFLINLQQRRKVFMGFPVNYMWYSHYSLTSAGGGGGVMTLENYRGDATERCILI